MTESESESGSDSHPQLTIAVLDRGSKYLYERMGACLAILSTLLCAGVVISLLPFPLGIVLALPMGVFIFFLVRWYMKSGREEKLVITDKEPGLVINDDGISGSIVLLEGKKRDELLASGQTRFNLKWSDISQVLFESPKGRRSSPPYLVITPKEEFQHEEYYFLVRDAFWGKEERMADIIRAHGIRVEIEGKIH